MFFFVKKNKIKVSTVMKKLKKKAFSVDFPCDLDGKESASKAGVPGSIPGSEGSP